MKFDIPTEDEDELWLLERTVRRLQKDHGHSEAAAIALLNNYYRRFTDPQFCDRYGISVQTFEFFCREESLAMADRVHYHEALGHEPNEAAFIQWEREIRLP